MPVRFFFGFVEVLALTCLASSYSSAGVQRLRFSVVLLALARSGIAMICVASPLRSGDFGKYLGLTLGLFLFVVVGVELGVSLG